MLYERLVSMSMLYERQVVQKARVITRDPSHTSATHYQLLPSGLRFRMQDSLFTTKPRSN